MLQAGQLSIYLYSQDFFFFTPPQFDGAVIERDARNDAASIVILVLTDSFPSAFLPVLATSAEDSCHSGHLEAASRWSLSETTGSRIALRR